MTSPMPHRNAPVGVRRVAHTGPVHYFEKGGERHIAAETEAREDGCRDRVFIGGIPDALCLPHEGQAVTDVPERRDFPAVKGNQEGSEGFRVALTLGNHRSSRPAP